MATSDDIGKMQALAKLAIQVPNIENYLKPGALVLSYGVYFVILEDNVVTAKKGCSYRAYNFTTQAIFYSNYILHGEFVMADNQVYIIQQ